MKLFSDKSPYFGLSKEEQLALYKKEKEKQEAGLKSVLKRGKIQVKEGHVIPELNSSGDAVNISLSERQVSRRIDALENLGVDVRSLTDLADNVKEVIQHRTRRI